MEVFAEILILLLAARLLGEGARRLGQPAAVGELTAGVVLVAAAALLGPSVPLLAGLPDSPVLKFVADFGIFFLVLMAGIEMRPKEMAGASGTAFVVALGGMAVPLVAGFALGWVALPDSELKATQAFLIGVAISISAIPATVKVLMEFGVLHQRVGRVIVSAAVFDDIFGLFLLALLTGVAQTGRAPELMEFAVLVAKTAAFFAVTMLLGAHVYPRISRRVAKLQVAALEFSMLCGVGLAYGLFAEAMGMHWGLGAFMAGLYFEAHRVGKRVYQDQKLIVGAIANGFLGPLFFATIGIHVDLAAVWTVPGFLAALLFIAFAGKLIGAGGPARLAGLSGRESAAVGVGMSARGAVELMVLSIAREAGLFDGSGTTDPVVLNLYSALVLVAVITTLVAPAVLRRILPKHSTKPG